jgi:hypothetical protein
MKKSLSLFAADADQWEADGMTIEDEDALVLALWRWYRERPNADGLSVVSKVLYSSITARLTASEKIHDARSRAGIRGNQVRWFCESQNGRKASRKGIADPKSPSASAPSSASTTPSSFEDSDVGDAPKPPALTAEDLLKNASKEKRRKFVKPTVEEVRAYCREQGYAGVDPDRFVDFYESKGWIVGKSRMRDWQAAARNWHRGSQSGGSNSAPIGSAIKNASTTEADYVL